MPEMSPQLMGTVIGLAITDAFLLFVVGMIVVQRIEMFIRAHRIQSGVGDSHTETVA